MLQQLLLLLERDEELKISLIGADSDVDFTFSPTEAKSIAPSIALAAFSLSYSGIAEKGKIYFKFGTISKLEVFRN